MYYMLSLCFSQFNIFNCGKNSQNDIQSIWLSLIISSSKFFNKRKSLVNIIQLYDKFNEVIESNSSFWELEFCKINSSVIVMILSLS